MKWFNPDKGFGFNTQDGGKAVFVHHSEIDAPGGPVREGKGSPAARVPAPRQARRRDGIPASPLCPASRRRRCQSGHVDADAVTVKVHHPGLEVGRVFVGVPVARPQVCGAARTGNPWCA